MIRHRPKEAKEVRTKDTPRVDDKRGKSETANTIQIRVLPPLGPLHVPDRRRLGGMGVVDENVARLGIHHHWQAMSEAIERRGRTKGNSPAPPSHRITALKT